jgi:murein DD-endopeptidase MepM/ murein hydrolase activator NlpD
MLAGLGCGIDYRAEYVRLYAQSDALVERVYSGSQGGNWLHLLDSKNRSWQYAHLSEYYVKQGDRVKMGQVVAKTGNTGHLTTGPHLHLQVLLGSKRLDPEEIFNNELPKPMTKYNDKVIRNSSTGEFALVVRGKKFIMPPEPGVLALLTFMQRESGKALGNNILNVSVGDWDQLPVSPDLKF